eukprot:g2739.t1
MKEGKSKMEVMVGKREKKREMKKSKKKKKKKKKNATHETEESRTLREEVRQFLKLPQEKSGGGKRSKAHAVSGEDGDGAISTKKDKKAEEMSRRLKCMKRDGTETRGGTEGLDVVEDACWWTTVPELDTSSTTKNRKQEKYAGFRVVDASEIDSLWTRAEELWVAGEEKAQDSSAVAGNADSKFLREVMQAGTLSDRVAALALMVQQRPLYSLSTLQKLTTMASKQGQRSSLLAIEALKDLYVENVLPPRRLVDFQARPHRHPKVTDAHLVVWYFEAEVKRLFTMLVEYLERTSFDNLEHFKMVAIRSAHAMLTEKPEGEARLLSVLVNKLGDPHRKVAAKTMHLLQQLSAKHPNMQPIIVREIQQFMHRPNVSEVAQYFSILFLNQIFFRRGDAALAKQVVLFYFDIFKRYVEEMGVVSSRSNGESGAKTRKKKSLEKLTKKQRQKEKQRRRDEKIATQNKTRHLSALLTGVNRAFPYASDLLMKDTGDASGRKAFDDSVDALFKISHVAPLTTGVQALTFLFQIVQADMGVSRENEIKKNGEKAKKKEKKNAVETKSSANSARLQTRFYRALYQRLLAPELWSARGRLKLVLNLIYKATKYDPSPTRARAFLKRLLQVSAHGTPAMSCGALYLASSILAARKAVCRRVVGHGGGGDDDDDDGGDTFYDPRKRTPLHAGAEKEEFWELALCGAHYHPSVEAFCKQMCPRTKSGHSSKAIKYDGDPLRDFSLVAFLNRFSYRNPKQSSRGDGEDDHEPMSHAAKKVTGTEDSAPVNSNEFLQQPVGRIRPDEVFFYRFFTEKAKRETSKTSRKVTPAAENRTAEDEEAAEEAFAQKLAESLMKDNCDDDDDFDFEMSSDDDDDEEDDGGADDESDVSGDDEEADGGGDSESKKNKKKKRRLFAAAEEFAEILEASGAENGGKNAKQAAWERGALKKKRRR